MDERHILDHEALPDGTGVIYLLSDGGRFSIHVNGYELMGDGAHGSEDALADFACDRLADLDGARILVGGLGMGFTLAAALRRIGPDGRVTVAELMRAVVRWNRQHVGAVAGHPLDDPRVDVHLGDVIELVEGAVGRWSAILLDVDNGPMALTRPHNSWLYGPEGLAEAYRALIAGGVLGIWSAYPDDALTERLTEAGFDVEMLEFTDLERAAEDGSPDGETAGTQVLWMARRP